MPKNISKSLTGGARKTSITLSQKSAANDKVHRQHCLSHDWGYERGRLAVLEGGLRTKVFNEKWDDVARPVLGGIFSSFQTWV